jgi:hypothetical protein
MCNIPAVAGGAHERRGTEVQRGRANGRSEWRRAVHRALR